LVSFPIEEREVEEEFIDAVTEAEVEAERGVDAAEMLPERRARERVIGESDMAKVLRLN
jgi:hypothetical protein